jgi:uncharacterized membrane protein
LKRSEIVRAIVLAAMYAVLVNVFHPISFMTIQVRVANALIGIVPLFGMPAVYGLTLGVFLANLTSPLGLVDWFSFIPSFIGLMIVYKLRKFSVFIGLVLYSILLGAWVAFMLWYIFGAPYIITFIYVTSGITIATAGLGYLVYKTLSKIGVRVFTQ